MEKANILVLGTSGAGKSTLINTVIGKEVAKVGKGKHVTEEMDAYESEDLNFRLIDSRGFEYSMWNTHKAVKDMRAWMKKGLKDDKPRIHMMWFCVDATSKRFTKQMVKTVETVKKEYKDVPIIVVLTKSFFAAEDEENVEMVKENFTIFAKKTGMPIAIIPVLCQSPKGEDIPARGIQELIQVTEDNIDEAVRDAEDAVRKFDLKCKKKYAQLATMAAVTSGGLVGGIPIDIPDATILTPIETLLITAIAKIYGQDKDNDITKKITSRIIEAGAVSMVAKTALNQLKLIPGVVNIAADVLNAFVAASIIFTIGEVTIIVMEKAYKGEIDPEKLDWIDNLISDKMGSLVKDMSDIIAEQNGKIELKNLITSLYNKFIAK